VRTSQQKGTLLVAMQPLEAEITSSDLSAFENVN